MKNTLHGSGNGFALHITIDIAIKMFQKVLFKICFWEILPKSENNNIAVKSSS